MEKLNAIAVKKNKRLAYSKKYDFAIDTDKILLVEKGAYLSLSFPVYRDSVNGYMENLFLHPHRGRYIAFLARYKFSPADMENLDGGKPIADIVSKMSFVPLEDFDVENPGVVYTQGASGGGYSGTYWLIDGICHTWNHYTPVGEPDYWAPIACPNCDGCPSANSSDPGSHNPDGLYPLYYALVDLSPGSGGGGTPNGGGSGTGGQNPGTGFTTPFNPVKYEDADPLELQTPGLYNPHPIVWVVSPNKPDPHEDNCEELKKLFLNPAVKNSFNDLKNNKLSDNKENGYSYAEGPNGIISTNIPSDVNENYGSIKIPIGGTKFGASHTHQNDGKGYPMFSGEDIVVLHRLMHAYNYNGTSPILKMKNFVFTVTTAQGTYAIKVDSFTFHSEMESILMDKIKKKKFLTGLANIQNRRKPTDSPSLFQKDFINYLKKYNLPVSLYKSNDDFTNWSKLIIDPEDPNKIKSTNC